MGRGPFSGGTTVARGRWPGGRTRQCCYEHGFETETDARKQLAMVLGDLAAGRERARTTAVTLNTLADQWLIARKATHRSAYDYCNCWDNHLRTTLGTLRPNAVSVAVLQRFHREQETQRPINHDRQSPGPTPLDPYTDLVEDGHAQANPCRMLSKSTRATHLKPALRSEADAVPGALEDVVAVYQALGRSLRPWRQPMRSARWPGVRTSEVRALARDHIDLQRGTIHVQVQVERRKGRDPKTWSDDGTQVLKDGESRVLPVQPSLASILVDWKKSTSGKGFWYARLAIVRAAAASWTITP